MTNIEIRPLTRRSDLIETLASWYFSEWGHESPDATRETIEAAIAHGVDSAALPATLLAFAGEEMVGAAQLKRFEMPAFTRYEHWLGGVYVAPGSRGNAIAARLVRHCIREAKSRGLGALYLQTARLDGGLYRRLGWREVCRVEEPHGTVLVMKREPDGAPEPSPAER